MHQNYLLLRIKLFFILGFIVLLAACKAVDVDGSMQNATLQESLDRAKVFETGSSKITYDPKTRTNTYIGTEWTFFNHPASGVNDYEPYPDSFGVKDMADEGGQLGLKYGLEYIGKGAKFPGAQGPGVSGFNLNYIEIPLDIVYHYPLGPGSVRGGLGPYFAEGIGGGGPNGIYGENAGGFRRFDAGMNFMIGYKLSMGLSLDLSYDLGLSNIEYADQDVTGHNRCFSVNLGYQIGKLFAKK